MDDLKGYTINGYKFMDLVGKGSFGSVYKVLRKGSNTYQAAKVIQKKSLNENKKLSELFCTEIRIMKKMEHDNLLKLEDYFETTSYCIVIMKLYQEGDLEALLKRVQRLPESDVIHILKQLCSGFVFLHSKRIIHRDFKPANLLLDRSWVVIADFGLAKADALVALTYAGTISYMAPEITKSGQIYTAKVDIWSIGICAYEMLFGVRPFSSGQNRLKEIDKYSGQSLRFPDNVKISSEMKSLLMGMIEKDQEKRMFWNEIYNHPLFTKEHEEESKISLIQSVPSDEIEVRNKFKEPNKIMPKNVVYEKQKLEINPNSEKAHQVEDESIRFEDDGLNKDIFFNLIDSRFIYEESLWNFALNAAYTLIKTEDIFQAKGFLMGYILAKIIQLRGEYTLKQLAEKKNLWKLDYFEDYIKTEKFKQYFDTLKIVYTKADKYLAGLEKKEADKKSLNGHDSSMYEFSRKIDYDTLRFLQSSGFKYWQEIVSDMKKNKFDPERMNTIFKTLAKYIISLESERHMAFCQNGKNINWPEFQNRWENLNYQKFCFDPTIWKN